MVNRLAAVLALCGLMFAAACSDPPPPLSVSEGMVTVENQTGHDWTEVLITVNDHFRGFVPVLKSEGRANAPLSQLTTGHGQRWTQGARVKTIDVTAKSADGTDVNLSWGRDEQK
ncbi:MAG: hypothetical protein WD227_08480 [Vicinamibacterales bacterium]